MIFASWCGIISWKISSRAYEKHMAAFSLWLYKLAMQINNWSFSRETSMVNYQFSSFYKSSYHPLCIEWVYTNFHVRKINNHWKRLSYLIFYCANQKTVNTLTNAWIFVCLILIYLFYCYFRKAILQKQSVNLSSLTINLAVWSCK